MKKIQNQRQITIVRYCIFLHFIDISYKDSQKETELERSNLILHFFFIGLYFYHENKK